MTMPTPALSAPLQHVRSRTRAACCTALLLLLPLAPAQLGAQVAIVTNAANALEELSTDALRRLYLGQSTALPGGRHAQLATHAPSAERFDRDVLRLKPEIVRSRWMAMTFRGEATSIPTDFSNSDDVKRFVHEHADALAYLPFADVDATVKVLRIDGRRPADSGYLLR
jgi:hypothetical protein